MIKRVAALLAVAAVSLFVSLFGVQAAPAQASLSQCAGGQMCIWTNSSYGGSFTQYAAGTIYQAPGHCWKFAVGGTFDNSVSSYDMDFAVAGYYVHFFDNNSCSGTSFTQEPPGPAASMPSGWNDRLGSISVNTTP